MFIFGDGVAAPEFGATGEVTGFDNGGSQGLLVWSERGGDAFSNFAAASASLTTWCGPAALSLKRGRA